MADDQKINLRCVLTSSKEGVPLRMLMRDYRQLVSAELDLQGHANLTAYLRTIPDVVRLSNTGGEIVCHGVASERTSHIEALIARQKTNKKKRARSGRGGRGGGGGSFRGASSAGFRGRASMSSASSLSSASAFSNQRGGRASVDRGAYRGQLKLPSAAATSWMPPAARGRGFARGGGSSSPAGGGGRRPLQEQQIYVPPGMRSSSSAGSDVNNRSGGSGNGGFSSRGGGFNSGNRTSFGAAAPHSPLFASSRPSLPVPERSPKPSKSLLPAPSPPRSRQASDMSQERLDNRVQNLSIASQPKPADQQPELAKFVSLLAAARSLLQPRGTERNYFWRQAAERSGVALPAQFDALEADLLAEGALRIEDVLGRLMYYPGDPVAASGSFSSCPAAIPDDPDGLLAPPTPRTPKAQATMTSRGASVSAEAEKPASIPGEKVDEWGFEIGDDNGEADFGDGEADFVDGEADDEDDEADAFLDIVGLPLGQQFSALCLGSDGNKSVWLYTLDSQLESELEAVMKEATQLFRFLRTRMPRLYAVYCLATMPEEVLGQQLLLMEPEDGMELLRCRLASDQVTEDAVKIQLFDKHGPPIDVPMSRLRRFPPELITELSHTPTRLDIVASQTLSNLCQIPDAVARIACQDPPTMPGDAEPELCRFAVESTVPELQIRRLLPA